MSGDAVVMKGAIVTPLAAPSPLLSYPLLPFPALSHSAKTGRSPPSLTFSLHPQEEEEEEESCA